MTATNISPEKKGNINNALQTAGRIKNPIPKPMAIPAPFESFLSFFSSSISTNHKINQHKDTNNLKIRQMKKGDSLGADKFN